MMADRLVFPIFDTSLVVSVAQLSLSIDSRSPGCGEPRYDHGRIREFLQASPVLESIRTIFASRLKPLKTASGSAIRSRLGVGRLLDRLTAAIDQAICNPKYLRASSCCKQHRGE